MTDSNSNVEHYEATGDNALTAIQGMLSNLDLDADDLRRVAVTVERKPDDDGTSDSTTDGRDDGGPTRELGEVGEHTIGHAALWLLKHTTAETSVDISENTNLDSGSVSGALTGLYKRKLVDRTKQPVEGSGGRRYVYTVNDHGQALLNEYDKPDVGGLDLAPENGE